MKKILNNFNKVFENRVRLGIMSILMVNEWVDFNTFKEMLGASDGNLASHMATLEKQEYVEVNKQFVGRKTSTTYNATTVGKKAFKDHLDALERLLNMK